MKKIVWILVLGAAFCGAHAQEGVNFRLFSAELGVTPTLDVTMQMGDAPLSLGVNFQVGDAVSTGFRVVGFQLGFFNLKYRVFPMLRGVVEVGSVIGAAVPLFGLGFELVPYTRPAGASALAEFRMGIEYIVPGNFANQMLMFSLVFGLGA